VGRHKSLNYLFYLTARQYALDRGAKEAIILEADGLVSEGAATSLVYALGGEYFTPAAASALPGVTLTVLARGLARRNLSLKWVPTDPVQIRRAGALWLVNSLMGIMPVASWDGEPMPQGGDTTLLQEILRSEAGES
jgi:branched-chain amino acid aminotransferase/para-aminobenzoate synthetase component 1